jgi:DNA helicase-2/ATP-dependent DNA helicase PcrA
MDPILDPLNPEQREAVIHGKGHLLMVAGPGTGKTMTLTHRIAHLLRSGAVGEWKYSGPDLHQQGRPRDERTVASIDRTMKKENSVFVFTFHGFCLDVLRNDGHCLDLPDPFSICSETDTRVLAEEAVSEASTAKSKKIRSRRLLKNLPHLKLNSVSMRNRCRP